MEKPILIDFTEGFRQDRTSAPQKHNRDGGAGLPTDHRDVRLPSYWKKKAICYSASIGYFSIASSEVSSIDIPINQDIRRVILSSATQTPERPNHSVEKGTSGLVPQEDTRVIDSTSKTQRTNRPAILQQVNHPIVYHNDNSKSNN